MGGKCVDFSLRQKALMLSRERNVCADQFDLKCQSKGLTFPVCGRDLSQLLVKPVREMDIAHQNISMVFALFQQNCWTCQQAVVYCHRRKKAKPLSWFVLVFACVCMCLKEAALQGITLAEVLNLFHPLQPVGRTGRQIYSHTYAHSCFVPYTRSC